MSEGVNQDVKMARPIAVVDLWDIDDRIERLENTVERLEKVVTALAELYGEERVKNWELILKEMLKKGSDHGRQWRPKACGS